MMNDAWLQVHLNLRYPYTSNCIIHSEVYNLHLEVYKLHSKVNNIHLEVYNLHFKVEIEK